MSYEAAPATSLLATSCACCGRPLLDAQSVTLGIGPVCRERHGYSAVDALTEDERVTANQLIHEAACADTTLERVEAIASALQLLGMVVLAAKIRERFFGKRTVHVLRGVYGGRPALLVTTPWADGAAQAFSTMLKATLDGRQRAPYINDAGQFGGWLVWMDADAPVQHSRRQRLWNALRAHFAGYAVESVQGRALIV